MSSTWLLLKCSVTFFVTVRLVYLAAPYLAEAGFVGVNRLDPHKRNLPESVGAVAVGLLALIWLSDTIYSYVIYMFLRSNWEFLPPVLWICVLGCLDDVWQMRWSTKLLGGLPAATWIAANAYSIPPESLLCGEIVLSFGRILSVFLPNLQYNLTHLVVVVMESFHFVFATHAINIHAGLNGIEAGQSAIAALAMSFGARRRGFPGAADKAAVLASASAALMWTSFYPADSFIGNGFVMLAGSALAAIATECGATVLLMVVLSLQWANFFISCPQLLGIRHCPRHRMPRLSKDGLHIESSGNGTLINLILEFFGPMTEQDLVIALLIVHAAIAMSAVKILT